MFSKHRALCRARSFSATMHPMIALSHISAYKFWRAYDGRNFRISPFSNKHQGAIETRNAILAFAQDHDLVDQDGKVHITAFAGSPRIKHAGVAAHAATAKLETSLMYINEMIPISNPALTFLHMATLLEPIPLVALGNELCSKYALTPNGIKQREAIINTTQLHNYLATAPKMRAVKKAGIACGNVIDGARSPMEWKCFMLLTLTHMQGGAKFARPQLNRSIALQKPIQSIDEWGYPREIASLECDLVWNSPRIVVVEYQGKEWHISKVAMQRDVIKSNLLTSQGILLFELTSEIVYDEIAFQEFCDMLAKALLHRNRIRTAHAIERSRELRRTILPTNWREIAIP